MRTELREYTLYKFNELSDKAKDHVISTYWAPEAPETDFIYEDAARMGALMGIEMDEKPVKLMGGGVRYDPTIWFSGFWSQGDGACFEGYYRYAKGAVEAIKKETGFGFKNKDGTVGTGNPELIRIATVLQNVQRRFFYKLTARIDHRGHYYHSGCMEVRVDLDDNRRYNDSWSDTEEEITQAMRDFADWIYKRLEEDYDYQTSEECVAENCEANGYEFDEEGTMQ